MDMPTINGRRIAQTAAAASTAGPYIRRLMSDNELRDELRNLVRAASHFYEELGDDDRLHALVNDRKIRKDIDRIVEALQNAAQRVEKQSRGPRWSRYALIGGLAGATAALLVYPRTRERIMGAVGGVRRTTVDTVEDLQEKAA